MREADWACERVGGGKQIELAKRDLIKSAVRREHTRKRGIFVLRMVAIFDGWKGAMVTISLCLATHRPDACHISCGLDR